MAKADKLSTEEVDRVLKRFDQTATELQRQIVCELLAKVAAAQAEVNELGRRNAALVHACYLGLGSANDAMVLAVQFNCRKTEQVSRERVAAITQALQAAGVDV